MRRTCLSLVYAIGQANAHSATVTTFQENIIGGIRFEPCRYPITRLESWETNDVDL